VELAIAVFILGVVLAVSVPAFSRSYRAALFRQTVRDSATACQLARLQAVLHQRPVSVHVDLDRQQLWVAQDASDDAGAEPGANQVLKVIEVSHPVRILSAQRAGEPALQEGATSAVFQPNGTADALTVVFHGGARSELLALMLDPVTGRATITEVRR